MRKGSPIPHSATPTAAAGAPSPTQLQAAVADAYRAFARFSKPSHPLDVCLHCCVSEKFERELRELPLKRLTAHHLYEYNCSAKSEVQGPREVGYFVPRMLELLADGADIHHSIEISLDRLGRCPPGSWSEKEQAALSRFALAYFDVNLRGEPLGVDGRCLLDDPLSVLVMFDIGGLAIDPLLDLWLKCEHPFSTVQFVQATYWDFWEQRDYSNAFASDRPDFRQKIKAWLLDPEHRERFTRKLLSPDFLVLAEARAPTGHTSFSMMVDSVFEHLTR